MPNSYSRNWPMKRCLISLVHWPWSLQAKHDYWKEHQHLFVLKRVEYYTFWLFFIQEEKFLADQRDYLDSTLKRIISENKREISETERQCLLKKQALLRGINACRLFWLVWKWLRIWLPCLRFYVDSVYNPSALFICQNESPLFGTWKRRTCTRDTSSSNSSWRTSISCRDTSSSRNTRRCAYTEVF